MFLIRWIIAALIFCTVLPWSVALLAHSWQQRQFIPNHHLAVLLGLGFGLALIFWKKPNWFIHTVIHESAHALACLFLGVRIRNFQVSDGKGGMVVYDKTDAMRSTIISLAPYTLPLVLIPLFIAQYFVSNQDYLIILSGLICFAYIHHLHGLYHNIRLNFWGRQADLSKAGKILSIACISSCLALVSAWTIYTLSHA